MNRKSTHGTLKILVNADAMLKILSRLNNCWALLAQSTQNARCMLAGDVPGMYVSEMSAVADLLNAITGDFYEEIKASVDTEYEARKRNRQRTTKEVRG